MNRADGPTLADDEAALREYAHGLSDAIERIAVPWLSRLIDQHAPGLSSSAEVHDATTDFAATMVDTVRNMLSRDIADQTTGPLDIMRQSVGFPTLVLAKSGAPVVERGDFERRAFPDDVYNLTPASFADIHPDLHEPGILWGAAKAHVHLRRRRETTTDAQATQHVVVLSADLMDRSKISAAFPDAVFVRSTAKLVAAAADADLVLVDLAKLGDPAPLVAIDASVIAFGSHVDDAALAAAKSVGAQAMARSVFFRRLEAGDLGRQPR